MIVNGELCAYMGRGGEIVIPEGVKRIQRAIFFDYISISVRLPQSLEVLGDAFTKSRELVSIVLPMGLKTVEKKAFFHCPQLTDVTVTDPMTVIEDEAFLYTSVTLHAPVGSFAETYAKEKNIPFKAI